MEEYFKMNHYVLETKYNTTSVGNYICVRRYMRMQDA